MAGTFSPFLFAFIAVLMLGLGVRGQLSPDLITDLDRPFSEATLTVVAFVALLSWAVAVH